MPLRRPWPRRPELEDTVGLLGAYHAVGLGIEAVDEVRRPGVEPADIPGRLILPMRLSQRCCWRIMPVVLDPSLMDGLGSALVSSAAAVGTALVVLRTTLRHDRARASRQEAASRELFLEQVRANGQQLRTQIEAEERLARQRASLDAAANLATRLAALSDAVDAYRLYLAGEGRRAIIGRLPPVVEALGEYNNVARANSGLLIPAGLRQQVRLATETCGHFAQLLRYEATDYLLAPQCPDSTEAASLTKAGRAWQRMSSLVSEMSSYTDAVLAAVIGYQEGGEAPEPIPNPFITDNFAVRGSAAFGIATLTEWVAREGM